MQDIEIYITSVSSFENESLDMALSLLAVSKQGTILLLAPALQNRHDSSVLYFCACPCRTSLEETSVHRQDAPACATLLAFRPRSRIRAVMDVHEMLYPQGNRQNRIPSSSRTPPLLSLSSPS